MPMYSDRRPFNNLVTQRSAKRGPPPTVARGGLPLEARWTASRRLFGATSPHSAPFLASEPPVAITVVQSNVITL